MSVIGKYAYYLTSAFTLVFRARPLPQVLSMFLGRQRAERPVIEMQGLQFRARTAMDVWSLKETILDDYYERYGFKVGEDWSVIDIGGGIGDFTIQAAYYHPRNQVFAFEPTPSSFSLLQENLQLNQVSNARVFPMAVWSSNSDVVIDTAAGEPVQFTSEELRRDAGPIPGKVVVPGLSLASVFEKTGIQTCDLMKLDCEGAEYEILFNAPEDILKRIERIVMEYHDNVVEYTHEDMARFLTEKGYHVDVFPNVVHNFLGYLRASR